MTTPKALFEGELGFNTRRKGGRGNVKAGKRRRKCYHAAIGADVHPGVI